MDYKRGKGSKGQKEKGLGKIYPLQIRDYGILKNCTNRKILEAQFNIEHKIVEEGKYNPNQFGNIFNQKLNLKAL